MAVGEFLKNFLSLGSPTNKQRGEFKDEREEGVVDTPISELTLDKEDDELIELKNAWQKKWEDSKLKEQIESRQKENEKYWKGEHYSNAQRQTGQRDQTDNIIFEALETFLPVVSRQVAQPVIDTSANDLAKVFARKVEDRIVDIADNMRLRLKIKKVVRYWALYFLGVAKIGWSLERDEIAVEAIRPQQLILDPDAITDECEYFGEYLGHYRTDSASDLITRFPSAKKEILGALGKDHMGTKIRYIEWWTADFVFWTLGSKVLSKARNPHWNYDQTTEEPILNELGEPITREDGTPITNSQTIQGRNHFRVRKIPFAFLSVFNLGKGTFDETNLVEQVLPLQDIINKRTRQIDKNADHTNGGSVVSGDHFTKEQAKGVGEALRRGQTIWVPTGDVNRAFTRTQAPPLPNFVHNNLVDTQNRLLGIFGVTGLSAQGIKSEETVRGKIIVRDQDTSRSALVVDQVEQFYDYIFNWMIQLMMVYYDTPRMVTSSAGDDVISSEEFVWPLVVSVKEGSLIPKDRLTIRNEAIELWGAGAISPVELFEKLEFPQPKESAKALLQWQMIQSGQLPPQVLFPDFPVTANQAIQQFMQQQGQQQEPQTVENQNILNQVPI